VTFNRAGTKMYVAVGVTVARDGSLLVSDDGSNVIWKVSVKK
jgi:glucose/arabinose dehydrogenase